MEKLINTRIALKIDTFENWSNDKLGDGKGAKLVLKRGEIGLCEIPSGNAAATTAPTVLFKVGDGATPFGELKWASALAADVYSWAKKSEEEFKTWLSTTAGFATDAEVKTITDGLSSNINKVEAYFDENGKAKTALDAEKLGGVEASKYAKLTDVEAASHDHTNKTVLDGITAAKVAAWDAAEQNAKDYTDILASTVSKMDEAYKKADGDLDDRIKALEAIDHSHTFVESELNKIKDGDVAKWNAAEQNAKNYADGLANNYDQKGAASAAEAAAKSYTDEKIGTVPADKTVVTMISDAETAAKSYAKSYADGLAGNYDAEGSAAQALTDAKAYTDQEVGKISATVSAMDTAYKAADTALSGRLDTVEGKLANVSNVMDFRGAVTELPTEISGYQNGDVIVVTGGDNKGKEYVLSDGAWVEFGNVDAQQTAIASLQEDVDKLEQSAADLAKEDAAIRDAFAKADTELQTAINGKVAQGDFDTLSGKVTTLEGKPAVGITATQISNWDGEVGAKAAANKNASDISALQTSLKDGGTIYEKIEAVEGRATTLEGYFGTSGRVTVAEGEIDALQTLTSDSTKGNEALATRIKTVEDDLNTATTGLKAKVNANASAISDLDTRIDAYDTRFGTKDDILVFDCGSSTEVI